MSKFQLGLLAVFGAFIVIAVILFSVYRGSGSGLSRITVWGSMTSADFNSIVSEAGLNTKEVAYTYVEKREATLDQEYTEALATNSGPDLIILPQSSVYKNREKLLQIPYSSVSQGDYQNTFIDVANTFMGSQGIYAIPFFIDPLVLYWNKDTFSSAGLVKPVGYWDELYAAADKFTVKDSAGNITKSVMALGETKNIPHAKDILSLLMLQAGSPIVEVNSTGLNSALSSNQGLPLNPTSAAVDFYTQFSDPAKPFYSWNRSLLPALSSFSVGDSAMYVGFASELRSLRAKSPTLNIGLATVPQSRTSKNVITYGKLYGVAISRQAANPGAALSAALSLASSGAQAALVKTTGLPPIRRDLLSVRQSDQALQVFYTAAIQSRGWIDPNPSGTDKIFRELIDSVTSGRARTSEAVQQADNSLQALIDGR
jgi:ABC-type glycerol-3-phosphate transport system substrate-binding protein